MLCSSVPKSQPLVYAQSAFDLHGLSDTEKIVDVIREVRTICDDFSVRGLPNFPSGVPFTFFEQYVTLRTYLAAALVAILVSVFLVLALVMCNPWIALIVVSECACAARSRGDCACSRCCAGFCSGSGWSKICVFYSMLFAQNRSCFVGK